MIKNSSIQAVAFDFTNVIFREIEDFQYTSIQLEIARFFGFINPDQTFIDRFTAKLGLSSERIKQEIRYLVSHMYQMTEPDMFEHLPELKYAGATNHLSYMLDYFSTLPIARHFDSLVCSGEIGFSKPDACFYGVVAERLGENPQRILFVDDSIENCEGALKFGFQVLHFQPGRKLSQEVQRVLETIHCDEK